MNKFSLKLYKSGKFYNGYGDDALILHEVFHYKYNSVKKSAGFPKNALVKIKNTLESRKISYQIYEKDNLKDEYQGIDKEYEETLKKALKNVELERRLDRIRKTLENMTLDDLEKLLETIESKHLNEK